MVFGHFGVALGAKGWRPKASLPFLLVAALGPDWVEIGFMLAGVRNTSLPSHGWAAVAIGTVVLSLTAGLVTRSRTDAALVALLYASHLGLDYLTARKPTYAGGPRIGLHWYGHPLLDFAAEAVVVLIGWWIYRRSFTGKARRHPLLYLLPLVLIAGQAVFDAKYAK